MFFALGNGVPVVRRSTQQVALYSKPWVWFIRKACRCECFSLRHTYKLNPEAIFTTHHKLMSGYIMESLGGPAERANRCENPK
jgi:hypothetical protein